MAVSVLIVGGGASGTLLVIRLLRGNLDTRVTLIERAGPVGRGLAYAGSDDRHVLNVVPGRMSALADDPEHFRRWLIERGAIAPTDNFVFVPRHAFGAYLEATLLELGARTGRLDIVRDTVIALGADRLGARAVLAGGRVLRADAAILATGHDTPHVPLQLPADPGLPVLILGTGLSMVDAWLSLSAAGRKVVALSRHGLLPAGHAPGRPIALTAASLPIGASPLALTRWLRAWLRQIAHPTGDWRPAVDALRPHTQRLWASWSTPARRQFLRHLKPWWDIHRHRLSPDVHATLAASLAAREIDIIAATPLTASPGAGRQSVSFRRRGTRAVETLEVADVLDCRGLVRDWPSRRQSLVGRLIAAGTARPDALGLGLDISPTGELIAAGGQIQPNLFALGPLTRGQLFEIEAIPEIRAQADRLASELEQAAVMTQARRA